MGSILRSHWGARSDLLLADVASVGDPAPHALPWLGPEEFFAEVLPGLSPAARRERAAAAARNQARDRFVKDSSEAGLRRLRDELARIDRGLTATKSKDTSDRFYQAPTRYNMMNAVMYGRR